MTVIGLRLPPHFRLRSETEMARAAEGRIGLSTNLFIQVADLNRNWSYAG